MAIQDHYRKRFHDLKELITKLEADEAPLVAERNSLLRSIQPTLDKIKEVEDRMAEMRKTNVLFDAKQELAMMVRALGGKTGVKNADGTITMPEKAEAAPAVEE